MILSITHSQKIKSLMIDLGKLIPLLLLVWSSRAIGQVLPCDSLSTDATWEIVGVAPGAVFCTSTAIELIVRTDSTYNEDFLSYQWQRKEGAGNFADIAGATNDTLNTTLTATAQFQCVVTCFNGDTGDDRTVGPITLTITLPTAGAISGAQTICNGGDPAAFTNTTSGSSATSATVSYKWQSQTGAGAFTDISGATQPTFNAPSGLTQTTAYRRITRSSDSVNSECLSTPTSPVTVTVQPVISPGTISGNQSICSGTNPTNLSGNAVAPTGGSTIAYLWEQSSNDIAFTAISGAVSASFDPTTNLTQNTFYHRITESTLNGVTCPSAPTASVEVTVRALPTPGSISGSQTICYQGDPMPFTSSTAGSASDGGTISYRWEVNTNSPGFPAGSWANPTTGTGAATAVFEEANNTLTSNRQYRRFAISTLSALACTSATATGTVQLTVVPQLTVSFEQNTATVCVGETAEFTVNGTPGAIVRYTVTGVSGNQFVELVNGTGVITVNNTSAAGTLTVNLNQIQITSPVTCTNTLNVGGTVTVIALPTASFSAGNSSTHCLASTYTLQLSGTANATVSYNLIGGSPQSATLSSSGSVTISGIALGIGSNTFQLTQVSLGSCSAPLTATFTVTVTSNPAVSVVALNGADFIICPNESVTLGSNTVGTAYQWFRNGIPVGSADQFSTSQTGSYTVAVTAGGCGGTSAPITISQAQVPDATITAGGNTTFCDGGSVTISSTVNSCTGCELLWSNVSAATSPSITVTDSETITLTAINDDGCSDTSNTINVIENLLPNVGVTASDMTICEGQTAALTANGATTYAWTNVDSGQSAGTGAVINVGVTGTYRVTGTTTTAGVACSNTAQIAIEAFTTPTLESITGPSAVCANSSAEILLQGTDDAVVSYRINGGSIQTVPLDGDGEAVLDTDPNFAGNSLVYTPVSITLGDCQGTVNGSASVQINPRPILASISDVEYCNNQDILAIVLSEASNSPVSVLGYDWDSFPDVLFGDDPAFGSITGEVINTGANPIPSEFTVWGVSQAGCVSDSVFFRLTANPGPIITEIADITLCDGDQWQTINLEAGLSGASITWESVGPDIGLTEGLNSSQIIAAATEGTVNIPDGNSGYQTQTITVNAQSGECGATPMSFNVNVLSKPIGTTAATWTFCRGSEVEISFSSTIDDAYFDWQLVEDSDFIGLPIAGDTAVDSVLFTTLNDDIDELSAAIAITPMVTDTIGSSIRTCVGSPQNVVVIVNPTPQITIVSNDVFCFQQSVFDTDFDYTIIPDTNVSYTWQVANAGLFEPDSGNDAIATQANNPLPDQVASNISFTPVYENHGLACEGTAQTVAVTVLPEPKVDIDFNSADFTLCSGESAEFGVSSSTDPVSTWNVAAASDNVSGFETGCENCQSIDDQLVLNDNLPGTVTYTVSSFIGGCEGSDEAFEYVVNPLPAEPQLTSDVSQSWCAGAQGAILIADTTADVVRYDWSNTTPGWNIAYGGIQAGIEGSLIYIDVPSEGGTFSYTLTAENQYGCDTAVDLALSVEAGASLPDYDVVIVNNGTVSEMLAVIPAIDGQTYQWGVLNQSDWSSSTFNGETAQVLFLDASFNPNAAYYYVDVANGDCVSRVFYNHPVSLIPQSVEEGLLSLGMQLFPNPFGDQLQIICPDNTQATQITIVDAMGRMVYCALLPAYQKHYTIETSSWAVGTYYLRAVSGKNRVSTTLIKF
jgi:hypothetical protein